MKNNLLLTEKEAAAYLSISLSKLQKSRLKASTSIRNGQMPSYIKLEGSIRYPLNTLKEFVSNRILKQYEELGIPHGRQETEVMKTRLDFFNSRLKPQG